MNSFSQFLETYSELIQDSIIKTGFSDATGVFIIDLNKVEENPEAFYLIGSILIFLRDSSTPSTKEWNEVNIALEKIYPILQTITAYKKDEIRAWIENYQTLSPEIAAIYRSTFEITQPQNNQ